MVALSSDPEDGHVESTGGCACGAISYRTEATLRSVANCHCERCRRITGHFMAATGCEEAELDVTDDGALRWYEPSPGVFYGFCSTCGSTLFWKTDDGDGWISITAGTVDQPSGLTTSAAWWTAEAADYHSLDRSILNHEYESGASGSEV